MPDYNPEVTEFLRNVAAYRARFPSAVSVWGPVFAEATLIDTMMTEHGARQEDRLATEVVTGRQGFRTVDPSPKDTSATTAHQPNAAVLNDNNTSTTLYHLRTPAQQPKVEELRRVVYASARAAGYR